MSKEMIISSSAHETRVAILEDDQVAEIFIERERSRGVVGNVYKGRVSKVLPGMQSAFVDLGLERDGFLYVTDVVAAFEELDRFETEEDEAASPVTSAGPGNGGNGGNGAPGGSGAGQRRDRPAGHGGRRDREKGPEPKIEDLLK
jgi:Rne/Rng family ribonuclease